LSHTRIPQNGVPVNARMARLIVNDYLVSVGTVDKPTAYRVKNIEDQVTNKKARHLRIHCDAAQFHRMRVWHNSGRVGRQGFSFCLI
jgi:hypothetical protein